MKYAKSVAVAIAAIALPLLSAPGQAAPMSDIAGGVTTTAVDDSTAVEQVRHRCYRHRGHWHCPRHRYYRDYGPGIHFYLGPRHRHYRRHHRHHHRHHWRHRRH